MNAGSYVPPDWTLLGGIAACAVCKAPIRADLAGPWPVYVCTADPGHLTVDVDEVDETAAYWLTQMIGSAGRSTVWPGIDDDLASWPASYMPAVWRALPHDVRRHLAASLAVIELLPQVFPDAPTRTRVSVVRRLPWAP